MYGTLISSVTVGAGGAASIDFTSIPQTPYTDLILVLSGKAASGGEGYVLMSLNGSSSSFTGRQLEGNGASVGSQSYTVGRVGVYSGATMTGFTNNIVTFPNYAGSTNKSISADSVTENNGTTSYQDIFATLWSNTSAITSLSLTTSGSVNWAQYTTAYLYGLTKGSGGATVS